MIYFKCPETPYMDDTPKDHLNFKPAMLCCTELCHKRGMWAKHTLLCMEKYELIIHVGNSLI